MCSLLYLNCCLLIAVRSTKRAGVFLEKYVGTAAKTIPMDRKNQKVLALLYLGLGPLRNTANSGFVPTEFAADYRHKDEVVEGKFSNLNFLPSTKKTTEYSFELFLSIYRYLIFFSSSKLHFCRTESLC